MSNALRISRGIRLEASKEENTPLKMKPDQEDKFLYLSL